MEQEAETGKKKKRSAFRKTADWASLIRNFATIVASFISVITLFILIRQNERTYQPDLVLSPAQGVFQVLYQDTIRQCEDVTLLMGLDSTHKTLALRITNLGLGAAKDIRISWDYDPHRLDDTVQLGNERIVTKAKYHDALNAIVFMNCMLKESLSENLDFCLPNNSEKEPTLTSFPLNFVRLWTNLFLRAKENPNLSNKQQLTGLTELLVTRYQDLTCTLTYQDINDRSYKKAYRVFVVPHFIDLKNNTLTLGIRLRDLSSPPKEVLQHQYSIYFTNSQFLESSVELK
ncbi:MAG: hypothetical protein ABMA02_01275 [Saprospiraceae bacterium]